MPRTPDYILDIPGLSSGLSGEGASDQPRREGDRSLTGRPWLAVYWRCCHVYSRIYRNRRRTAYQGRCPSCLQRVHASIGADGTECRLFFAE